MSSPISEYDIPFNFIRFIKFLEKNNILGTAIAAVLSDRINEVTNEFFSNIILPVINRDSDKDGVRDIKNFEESEVSVFGIKLKLGKFLLAILKFIIVSYAIFVISILLKKIVKIDKL